MRNDIIRSKENLKKKKELTDTFDDVTILGIHIRELGDAHNDSDAHPALVEKSRVLQSVAMPGIRRLLPIWWNNNVICIKHMRLKYYRSFSQGAL